MAQPLVRKTASNARLAIVRCSGLQTFALRRCVFIDKLKDIIVAVLEAVQPVAGTGKMCISIWYTRATRVGTGIISLQHINKQSNFVFLLFGLTLLLAQTTPVAFNGLPQIPWLENFAPAVYFNFVTITTPGYGEISPVLSVARFFVITEAIIGVVCMAILVASLTGVRMAARNAAEKKYWQPGGGIC